MTKTKITVALLRSLGANCQGLEDFRSVFPRGAKITLHNCLKAAEHNLDIDWFAFRVLSDTAREAYEKARATAWEAYEKARATAGEAYEKATATAFFEIYKKELEKGTEGETDA
jgi:hypothetical protein